MRPELRVRTHQAKARIAETGRRTKDGVKTFGHDRLNSIKALPGRIDTLVNVDTLRTAGRKVKDVVTHPVTGPIVAGSVALFGGEAALPNNAHAATLNPNNAIHAPVNDPSRNINILASSVSTVKKINIGPLLVSSPIGNKDAGKNTVDHAEQTSYVLEQGLTLPANYPMSPDRAAAVFGANANWKMDTYVKDGVTYWGGAWVAEANKNADGTPQYFNLSLGIFGQQGHAYATFWHGADVNTYGVATVDPSMTVEQAVIRPSNIPECPSIEEQQRYQAALAYGDLFKFLNNDKNAATTNILVSDRTGQRLFGKGEIPTGIALGEGIVLTEGMPFTSREANAYFGQNQADASDFSWDIYKAADGRTKWDGTWKMERNPLKIGAQSAYRNADGTPMDQNQIYDFSKSKSPVDIMLPNDSFRMTGWDGTYYLAGAGDWLMSPPIAQAVFRLVAPKNWCPTTNDLIAAGQAGVREDLTNYITNDNKAPVKLWNRYDQSGSAYGTWETYAQGALNLGNIPDFLGLGYTSAISGEQTLYAFGKTPSRENLDKVIKRNLTDEAIRFVRSQMVLPELKGESASQILDRARANKQKAA